MKPGLKKWLKRAGYFFLFCFILLNAIAARHAWVLTHFYPGAQKPGNISQLTFGQKAGILFSGMQVSKRPNSIVLPVHHDTVIFKTTDGLTIESWYAPHKNAKGVVALFHGHLACKSAVVAEAMEFYKHDYAVLLVDFRGHGGSEGDYCTIGYKEAEEVKQAYDYLADKHSKVFLWGISMGAAAITSAFDKYELAPAGVVLELPFGSLHSAVSARVTQMGMPAQPIAALLTFWGGTENGFNAFGFSPAMYAKKINCPVLLQAGKWDSRVSSHEIQSIYTGLAGHKRKVIYNHAGHQSLLGKEPEKWKENTFKFIEHLE